MSIESVMPSNHLILCHPLFLPTISSVAQSCLTFCDSMDCSTPGFPVHHPLPELAQTHVHRVGDAIQPSHPLSSPSPPTFNLSQHQGLCKRVSSSLCVYIHLILSTTLHQLVWKVKHTVSPTCPKLDSEWKNQHFHPCDLAPVCAVNHCTPKILKIKMLLQKCLNSRAPSIIPK